MNYLHISKLTKQQSESDYYLGPWCIEMNNIDDIDKTIVDGNMTAEEQREIADYTYSISKKIIPILARTLNDYHNKNFSDEFWEIILITWVNSLSDYIYFYYVSLKRTDILNIKMVVDTDEGVAYSSMEELRMNYHNQDFIHSTISFLINNMDVKNIFSKKSLLINTNLPLIKKSFMKELGKKIIYKFLNNKKSRILLYYGNPVFNTLIEMIKIRMFNKNISFSYKSTYITSNNDIPSLKIKYVCKNEFENLVIRYIEKYMPKSLLQDFSFHLENSLDYINKNIIIPSPGFYQDLQLIEIGLAKEYNDASIVFLQDGAYEIYSVIPEARLYYKVCDNFLTWGYESHYGENNLFIKTCDYVWQGELNSHKSEFDVILYQTRYTYFYGAPLFMQTPRNFKDYIIRRVEFIKSINKTKYKNNLILKFRKSKDVNYDEKKLMDSFRIDYNLYNDYNLKIKNCKLLYVDYPSSAMYIAIVYNTPFIFSFDWRMAKLEPNMDKHMQKLEKLGLLFSNPVDAANKIAHIMNDLDFFWKNKNIQDMREAFMKEFLIQDNNCGKKVIEALNNLNMLKLQN